jgi:hypothetical protein
MNSRRIAEDPPHFCCLRELVHSSIIKHDVTSLKTNTYASQFEYKCQPGYRVRKLCTTHTDVYNHNQMHLCNMGKKAVLSVGDKDTVSLQITVSGYMPVKCCSLHLPFVG